MKEKSEFLTNVNINKNREISQRESHLDRFNSPATLFSPVVALASSVHHLPPLPETHKRIIFIRHGETECNRLGYLQGGKTNIKLNSTGQRQAQLVAEALSKIKFDLLVSSSLQRAVETATEIRKFHPNLPYLETDKLKEQDWGIYDGVKADKEIRELKMKWDEGDLNAKFENGESPLEVQERSMLYFDQLLKDSKYQIILSTLHGRLMRVILSTFLYKSLMPMETFSHHNTTISCIDVKMPYTYIKTDSHLEDCNQSTEQKIHSDRAKENHPSYQATTDVTAILLDDYSHLMNDDDSLIGTASPAVAPSLKIN